MHALSSTVQGRPKRKKVAPSGVWTINFAPNDTPSALMDDGESEGDGKDSGEGSCGVGGGADEGSDVSKSCSLLQVFLKSVFEVSCVQLFRLCVSVSCINIEFALCSLPTSIFLSRMEKR